MTSKRITQSKAKATSAAKGRTADKTAKPKESSKPSRKAGLAAKSSTKLQVCLDLLCRKHGSTLDELTAATGWRAHSVRGFLSGTVRKRLGLTLKSSRDADGTRRYSLEQPTRGL